MTSKTMLYLERDQLEALRARAREARVPVTELVRRLIRRYLAESSGVPAVGADAYAKIVGLGRSGQDDIGDAHDDRIAAGLRREHLR